MSPPRTSIQIIGHGLAGAILAETLSDAGLRVRVWDDGGPAASQVAAGLYTPLTGRRLVRSWALEEALPVVNHFYPELEKKLQVPFFHPLHSLRIFRSEAERTEWERQPDPIHTRVCDVSGYPFLSPWGGCEVRGGGWVNLPPMLQALQAYRQQRGEWGAPDGSADITVWAEGIKASDNPLWQDIGWRHAQGDILTLDIPGLPEDRIYHPGKFLLPLGQQRFRCGATYDWDATHPAPTRKGRAEIEADLSAVLQLPFQVLAHEAGIRPVAKARVPVAGPHPEHPDQWIFNGFGSKGVLMAPWMAARLLAHLQNGAALPKETQAARRMMRERDRARRMG